MKEKLAALNDRISLRVKLTVMSIALIGLLLTLSSFGSISLLRTYLQENTDTLLTSTAAALADEEPLLLEERLALRQITLPRLPSDYYIAFLDSNGSLLFGLVSSANAKNAVPNLNAFTLEAVMATEGRPFDIEVSSKSGYRDLGSWRIVAKPEILSEYTSNRAERQGVIQITGRPAIRISANSNRTRSPRRCHRIQRGAA